jgi:hypothetical protein
MQGIGGWKMVIEGRSRSDRIAAMISMYDGDGPPVCPLNRAPACPDPHVRSI